MADEDIEKVRQILIHRGRSDLAELLYYSISNLDVSSTFGSYSYSFLTTFEIYSPIENYERLNELNEYDKDEILEVVCEVRPPKADGLEITEIRFFVDLDLGPERSIDYRKGLKESGYDYIVKQITKSEEKIRNKDFEGAITNARNLVESVCLHILEECGMEYRYDGNFIKLYKNVYNVLRMDPSFYDENFLRQILTGIVSIINGLSNLRNVMSDSHGKSKTVQYKPSERHSILGVNVARVISEFLYDSWKARNIQ